MFMAPLMHKGLQALHTLPESFELFSISGIEKSQEHVF